MGYVCPPVPMSTTAASNILSSCTRKLFENFCLKPSTKTLFHLYPYLQFSFHKNITFTAEAGADDKLPFLDTLVTFDNNSFYTDLYRKKTFTGLYYDYGSLTPHAYKLLQVFTMIMVALLRMLTKLLLFGPSFFVHIIFAPLILVFIWSSLVQKAFLKGTLFLYLLLIRLLNLFLTILFPM